MKALSSLDLHCMVGELKPLEGSRVDNIYQKGKEEFLFQLHKSNEGKKLLRVLVGKALFLASHKEEMETLSGFCMLLRKHLGNATLASLSQIEPERIIKIVFEAKDSSYALYIEFLGKGNVIFSDGKGIIIDALTHHEFRDRTIFPKQKYAHPTMQYNAFSLEADYLSSLLSSTAKESLVKCLAIDLGLGGLYAEEACAKAKMDKNKRPAELTAKEQSALLKAVKQLISQQPRPVVLMKNDAVSDVFPFPLETIGGDYQVFPSLSEALEHYCAHARDAPTTSYDAKVAELKRIIEQQEKNITLLEAEEQEQRRKADAIYANYAQISTILDELKAISRKHSWQDIQKKTKGHAIIKGVNPREKSIVLDIAENKSAQ